MNSEMAKREEKRSKTEKGGDLTERIYASVCETDRERKAKVRQRNIKHCRCLTAE